MSQSSKMQRAPSRDPRQKPGRVTPSHRRAAVAVGAALAAVAVYRKPDRLTWKVVGVRLAVDEQRSQREDRGAAGVDELRVQFLQRDFGTRQLRPQGGDRFDRQERIG